MSELKTFGRREFTVASALAALSGVAITITACGGGSSYSPSSPTPTPSSGDKVASISGNHGHSAVITAAELTAGAAVTVQLTTGQGHTHSVSLTATEVMQIAGGTRVSRESTNDSGHTHNVTFN